MPKHRRPLSQRKLDSCRENGSKSNGPVTPEGKVRSSQNATKHGFASRLTLAAEDTARAHTLDLAYSDFCIPTTPVELYCLETMIAAHVRMERLRFVEYDLLDLRLVNNNEMEKHFRNLDNQHKVALAFATEAKEKAIHFIATYEPRLHRAYRTAWADLHQLRPDIQPPSGFNVQRHRARPRRPLEQLPEKTNEPSAPPSPQTNPFAIVAALVIICLLSIFTAEKQENPAAQLVAKSAPTVEMNGFTLNHLTPISPA